MLTALSPLPASKPVAEDGPGKASLGHRVAYLVAVIVPFLGLVAAVTLLWGWGVSWVELGLLLGMYVLDGPGHHRRLPPAVHPPRLRDHGVVKFILAALGSMAFQGPLLDWSPCTDCTTSTVMRPETPTRRTTRAAASSDCCAASGTRTSAGS